MNLNQGQEKMAKEDFVTVLNNIANRIMKGDSFQGRIEWDAMPDVGFDDLEPGELMIQAVYRIGNSEGQGGYRFIGEISG